MYGILLCSLLWHDSLSLCNMCMQSHNKCLHSKDSIYSSLVEYRLFYWMLILKTIRQLKQLLSCCQWKFSEHSSYSSGSCMVFGKETVRWWLLLLGFGLHGLRWFYFPLFSSLSVLCRLKLILFKEKLF